MARRRVVVVGAGQAGIQVASSLRSHGFDGAIDLVGDERHLPYQRPPLSKEYLAGTIPSDGLWLRRAEFFVEHDVTFHRAQTATAIDRANRTLATTGGVSLDYTHLVLATGARPRRIDIPGAELPAVKVLRGVDDADELARQLQNPGRVLLLGAGFIGLELAAVARTKGHEVTVVESLDRPLVRAVSPEIAAHLVKVHRTHGTEILTSTTASALTVGAVGDDMDAKLTNGSQVVVDTALIAVGVMPNVELASDAGLSVENGIRTDEYLRTDDDQISAVGDCASFPSRFAGGSHIRLESVQNAVDQAKFVAARIVDGPSAPYDAVPWFWSHQFDMRLQMAGLPDADDRRVVQRHPEKAGLSVLRFADCVLNCVESINAPADHIAARKILRAGKSLSFTDATRPGFALRDFAKQLADY